MKPGPSRLGAFSLVEITLALGIATFCLIALMALLPVGIASNKDSLQTTLAASLATAVVSDLQAASSFTSARALSGLASPQYAIAIPAAGGAASTQFPATNLFFGGDGAPYPDASAPGVRFRVSIGFTPPSGGRAATGARVLVTWPAQGGSSGAAWPTNTAGAYEIFTVLNCN